MFSLRKITAAIAITVLLFCIFDSIGGTFLFSKLTRGKDQLFAYADAISEYKNEYCYYPMFLDITNSDKIWCMDSMVAQNEFIRELANRDIDGIARKGGCRRAITFLELSADQFDPLTGRLIDPFGNKTFCFLIDGNDDGKIDGNINPIKQFDLECKVAVFTKSVSGELSIYTWSD